MYQPVGGQIQPAGPIPTRGERRRPIVRRTVRRPQAIPASERQAALQPGPPIQAAGSRTALLRYPVHSAASRVDPTTSAIVSVKMFVRRQMLVMSAFVKRPCCHQIDLSESIAN